MKYVEKAMNSLKTAAVIGMAAAALSASAPQAEAENRRAPSRPQGYAVPRSAMPRNPGMAVPRAVNPRTIPPQLRTGVRIGRPGFSADFYFYMGPFGGFEGYVRYGNFYPFGWGPVPMSYFEIRSRQFMNETRFGPSIGVLRHGIVRYNRWGQPIFEQPSVQISADGPVNYGSGSQTVINGATKEEVEEIVRRTLERERASQHSETADVPQQDERIPVRLRYGGKVDHVQYDDEGIVYLNGLFEGMRKLTNGDVDLLPIDVGNYMLEIKDANAKDENGNPTYAVLGTINMQRYQNCLESSQLTGQLFSDLSRAVDFSDRPGLLTRADAMLQISTSGYSASSCR